MIFKKVLIEKYIPFSHCGNTHVEFYPEKPGVAILGSNGSGKSSLMRALTPFPLVRTMFDKGGKAEFTIEHNGSIYEIASDFANSGSPNHFIKDGVELNIGGTGDTQKDLVEEHLGLKPFIWDMISGNVHICSLVKSARKTLFSSHYPSDLTFVLEYDKIVSSQIRAYGNQIKLLQSREGTYRASLIDPVELKRMSDYRDAALSIIDRIDKINLLLENEIQQLRSNPAMQHAYHPEHLEGICYRFRQLRQKYVSNLVDHHEAKIYGEQIDKEHLSVAYAKLNSDLLHLEHEKEALVTTIQNIRDELNKFTNLKFASTDDKKTALLNELNVVKTERDELLANKCWEDIPLIPIEKILDVVDLQHDILDMVTHLHPYAGKFIGQEEISKLKNEINVAESTAATLMREKRDLELDLSKCQERLDQLSKNSYPQDCSRICALRSTLEGSIRDVRLRMAKARERIKYNDDHLKAASDLIEKNKTTLQEISPALPIMKCLWDTLSENYLTEIATKGETFIDCLNAHCTEISNRIRIGIEISKKYHRYKNLCDKYEQISHTLSMMESIESTQLSAEVIEGVIADRERKINEGLSKLTEIELRCNELVKDMEKLTDMGELIKEINDLIKETEICINIKIIRNRIEFDQEMIKEHTNIKNELSSKLRDIERMLQDQKRLSDILNTETVPQLELIRKKKAQWEAVEAGLSPNKGLPCIYLVRFINRLLSRANAYIKEVWQHDMEFVYLNEEEDLDFTLPVMMNRSTIVQDISMCSNGEKAMLDLAMTLAICAERGYLKNYSLKLDEIDGPLTESHRAKLTELIGRLLEEGEVTQLFLVSHFASQTGISCCENIVLNSEGLVIPNDVNLHADIH